MPELPEVETICRDLRPLLVGTTIQNITISLPRLIKTPRPMVFSRNVRQARIVALERKGKALVFTLRTVEDRAAFLVVHLRMTGQLTMANQPVGGLVIFHLSGGRFLCYNDSRTLGEIRLVKDWRAVPLLRTLGPDPLAHDFSCGDFQRGIRGKRGAIKSLLLNQRFLAGVGNIYACEALFAAGIQPRRAAASLRPAEAERLYTCLRNVLQKAIDGRGTSVRNYRDGRGEKGGFAGRLRVYGRNGKPCTQCGMPVRRTLIAGRGTFSCCQCQR